MNQLSISILGNIKKRLQELLFPEPAQCCFCLQQSQQGQFCASCWQQLSMADKQEFCRKCGRILTNEKVCPECLGFKGAYSFARAVGEYQGIYREILYQYKYIGKQSLARPMGRLMADTVLADSRYAGTQLIVPIPLAPSKYAQRKFNQSELLAWEVGNCLGLPVQVDLLKRVRDTLTQAKLTRAERRANLVGAFRVQHELAQLLMGKKLLLVDDVLTTGTTISEATRVLMANGAKEVVVLTWATGLAKVSNGKRDIDEP